MARCTYCGQMGGLEATLTEAQEHVGLAYPAVSNNQQLH